MSRTWSNRVVIAAVLLAGFGAAHLIDDFLYGVPADFGLSNAMGQVLAVVYFAVTSVFLALSARGHKIGHIGNLGLGVFLVAADVLKHGSSGLLTNSWRSGLFSQALAFGVMLTAMGLVVVSLGAWRHARRTERLDS